jgi:hypothetical protein
MSGDIGFSVAEVAVITALLGAVVSGLGMVFRLLLDAMTTRAERAERLVDTLVPTVAGLATEIDEQGKLLRQWATLLERVVDAEGWRPPGAERGGYGPR